MDVQVAFDQAYADMQLDRAANPFRRAIKYFYIRNILKEISGPTIDFGCGAAQLLKRLPLGSIGLEINRYLVQKLQEEGIDVHQYEPSVDQFALRQAAENEFRCLVMSHVLEHMNNASDVLRAICRSCNRLNIDKIIMVVPGKKGYATDITHKTFVDLDFLLTHNLSTCEGYSIVKTTYFPINLRIAGDIFAYNELKIVYRRTN